MPSILLFKRRWLAGSDDLVVPGILLFLTHFILFVIVTVFVSSSSDLDKWSAFDPDVIRQLNANETAINLATCAKVIRDYSFIFVSLLISAILLEIILTGFSMQGTVTNSEPRKPVAYILYTRSGLGVLEIIFSIAAAAALSGLWGLCPSLQHILALEVGIIVINFIILFIVIMVTICTFDHSGHEFYQLKMAQNGTASLEHLTEIITKFNEQAKHSWNRRLRRFCCCARDKSNTNIALDEVSHLLRDFFKDIDVVPSDILAGMVLLRHKQQCIELKQLAGDNDIDEYLCGRAVTQETKFIDPYSSEELSNYENLLHYCNYAIAAYGSLFYLIYHPATGLCKLFDQCLCNGQGCCLAGGASADTTYVEEGKCCKWETSAVARSLNESIRNTVIVYSSWKNNLYEQPFFVCVDFDKKTVVVTIRGTLSEMDALTDLVATPQLIDVEGNDGTWKAHKGILKGAAYLKRRLVDDRILQNAFSYDASRGTNNFQLVILGHSLGAGIAAILSIMLHPTFPQLQCYSYSPPGGLLSRSAVRASRHYINTAVYGKDLVIRTGIRQLLKMRFDMINLIRKSNKPKYKIIFGSPCKRTQERHSLFGGKEDRRSRDDQLLVTHPEMLAEIEDLYPPGRILHIVYKSQEGKSCCFQRSTARRSYCAIEANNEEDFGEILISHNMVTHHWPQELLKAMKKVLNASLPGDRTMKYSNAHTIPSHAQVPTNQDQTGGVHDPSNVVLSLNSLSNLTNQIQEEPPPTHETTNQIHEEPPPTLETTNQMLEEPQPIPETATKMQDILSGNQPNTLSLTVPIETKENAAKNTNMTSTLNDNSEKNSSSNNNKSGSNITDDKGLNNQQDVSVLGRFQDYMNAVLPDSNKRLKSRSRSMPPLPHCTTIDKNTLERARFEPNLIPKPPRSNSMRQPVDEPVSRDYSVALPSRTSVPCDVILPISDVISTDSIEFIDDDQTSDAASQNDAMFT